MFWSEFFYLEKRTRGMQSGFFLKMLDLLYFTEDLFTFSILKPG